jgi:antitoxin ParD1/3/4
MLCERSAVVEIRFLFAYSKSYQRIHFDTGVWGMNVSLTRELEELVNEEIKSGQYKAASEVVREGLRLVRLRREKITALRREIQVGVDEIERGEFVEYTSVEELFADVEAAVAKRVAKKRKPR